MATKKAPGELELIRSFVNSKNVEERTDAFDTPEGLADWIAANDLEEGVTVGEAERERAIELRESLRVLLLAHNGEEVDEAGALATLNRVARRSPVTPFFDGERVALRPAVAGVDGALARIVALVATAETDGTWARMKACASDGCQWAFYDSARNHSGRWCEMAVCGNRMKARAFRERSRRP
jgi:predicted RNA-binding Zn ribbon-like protein